MVALNRVSATKARAQFSDLINEVSVRGDRVLLERHGRVVAALIPATDLELLEALEDKYDVEAAREALAECGGRVSWKELKGKLGL